MSSMDKKIASVRTVADRLKVVMEELATAIMGLDAAIGILDEENDEENEELKTFKPSLELEPHNFQIDSNGWVNKTDPDGIEYLENPEGDIWEYLKCKKVPDDLVGEQLFTWDAAMRETAKAGKRMPTNEEWDQLLKTRADMPNAVLAGYRNSDGSFGRLTTYGFFWSSLESGSSAWIRYLLSGYATVYRLTYSKASGFSLRCLRCLKD